jgi:excisionase family DNA binding protein
METATAATIEKSEIGTIPAEKQMLKVRDFAQALGVSKAFIIKEIKRGKIKAVQMRFSGQFRIPRSEFDRYVAAETVKPGEIKLVPKPAVPKPAPARAPSPSPKTTAVPGAATPGAAAPAPASTPAAPAPVKKEQKTPIVKVPPKAPEKPPEAKKEEEKPVKKGQKEGSTVFF